MNNMRLRKIDDDGNILEDFIPVDFLNENNKESFHINNNYELFIPEDYNNSTIEISFDVNLTKLKKERKFKDDSIPFHIKKQRGVL